MKVSVTLRKSRSKKENIGILYFRVRDDKADLRAASSITINPEYWDASVPGYAANTPKKVVPIERQQQTNELIQKILNMIKTKYKKGMDAKWLAAALEDCTLKMAETKADDKAALPADEHNDSEEPGVIDYFKKYLEQSEFNDWHRQAQTSVLHRLQRYEKWLGYNSGNPDFRLSLELFDKEQVEDYADYMEHEHEYRDANRKFFDQFNIKNEKWIRPISRNGIISGIKRLNMFLNWAVKEGYLTDTSFRNVSLDQQLFGTPYYLTIEERDKVMNFDLSQYPRLERHRDKFIFQCLVGCRSNASSALWAVAATTLNTSHGSTSMVTSWNISHTRTFWLAARNLCVFPFVTRQRLSWRNLTPNVNTSSAGSRMTSTDKTSSESSKWQESTES